MLPFAAGRLCVAVGMEPDLVRMFGVLELQMRCQTLDQSLMGTTTYMLRASTAKARPHRRLQFRTPFFPAHGLRREMGAVEKEMISVRLFQEPAECASMGQAFHGKFEASNVIRSWELGGKWKRMLQPREMGGDLNRYRADRRTLGVEERKEFQSLRWRMGPLSFVESGETED